MLQEINHPIEIVAALDYPIEIHEVTTEDGYILSLFRIPYGHGSTTNITNENPILMNHGFTASAECFLWGDPEKTQAFFLADRNFDVWLLNDRGSWHSRRHVRYNPDTDKQFWKFTFHEIAVYDIANSIDYILNITDKDKVFYHGHSQGAMAGMLLLSERPEYKNKIAFYVAQSPGVIFTHTINPLLKIVASLSGFLQKLCESLNEYELLPKFLISNEQFRKLAKMTCGPKGFFSRETCVWILSSIAQDKQVDANAIPFITTSALGGASMYQGMHFLQLLASKKFMQMNWGPKENMKRYNSSVPPEYNLSNVKVPIILMYGLGDNITPAQDIIDLAKYLPNVVDLYEVQFKDWTHFDFLWGKDLKPLVLDPMFALMSPYMK